MPVEIVNNHEAFKQKQREAVAQGTKAAAEAFLQFTREGFASEGQDTWDDLAQRTNDERQEQGFPPAHPILKRLGILEGALIPGNPGSVFVQEGTRVTVGIGGGAIHPGYTDDPEEDLMTIADIALIHQLGIGIPKREIFVEPDGPTISTMAQQIITNLSPLARG